MEKQSERKWQRADVVKRKRAFATSVIILLFLLCMTAAHLARMGAVDLPLYLVPLAVVAVITLVLWFYSEKVRKEYEQQSGK
jgi:ABC-type bacteriocin/lantibiotic exporter with double-glycine peptidase domain